MGGQTPFSSTTNLRSTRQTRQVLGLRKEGHVTCDPILLKFAVFFRGLINRRCKTTQLCGDYFISHEIRIPIEQPGFYGKYPPEV